MDDSIKWRVPKSKVTTFFNAVTLVSFIVAICYAIIIYPKLPDEIPVHFNLHGEADGWGGKGAIFMFPLAIGPILILAYVIGKYSHFLHSGKLTEADKNRYIHLSQNIAMINAVIGLTLVYMVWMIKRNAYHLTAFEPWSFYIIIGALVIITVRLIIQSGRWKNKRRKIDT